MAAAIKATKKNSRRLKDANTDRAGLKLLTIRATFVGFWLFCCGIIFLIAILTDINWTRPNLEDFIGQSLHRNVKLGRLYWHFGFKGLTVQTSRLLVAEHSGEPFLMAGNCEIGFSFWPLLCGQGQIHHFDLQNVLFMAVHTGEHTWNFDDLLVACPEVNFVDSHHGHVFVIDRQPVRSNRFPDTELNDVEIKLHRAGNFTPAQTSISFALPAENNRTRFHFAGYMWDQNQQWWQSQCHFHLDCQHFSLQNWQALVAAISGNKQSSSWSNLAFNPFISAIQTWSKTTGARQIGSAKSGLFDITAEADGVPSKKLNMNWQGKAYQLTYMQPDRTIITLPEISSSAELELTNNHLRAKKLNIRMPDDELLINCKGDLQRSNDNKPLQTQAEIIALLGDLKQLHPVLNIAMGLIPANPITTTITNLHNGKLFLDWKFSQNNQNATYSLETTAADCKINDIAPLLLKTHFQPKYLEELCLSKEARFAGTVLIKSDGSLAFKDCDLEDKSIAWNFAGQMDQSGRWSELSLGNKDLQLAQLSKARVKGWLGLNPNCQMTLAAMHG